VAGAGSTAGAVFCHTALPGRCCFSIRFANSRLSTKHNVGPLRIPDGSITVSQSVKAMYLELSKSST